MLWLSLPSNTRLHAPGIMNVGHEKLECEDCHLRTEGSLRQKLQANVRFWIGMRESFVSLGHQPVANEHCLECHERPNERHPVFRFFEPRFKKARAEVGAQFCISCHREHNGVRVSTDLHFCAVCHQRLALKNDPLMNSPIPRASEFTQASHQQLVKTKQWQTCLGCHDFHGNHRMKTATSMDQLIDPKNIRAYFQGGKSPYSQNKYHKAKQKTNHEPGT
ncbi:hypothetical protein [Kaarinaea lacus]